MDPRTTLRVLVPRQRIVSALASSALALAGLLALPSPDAGATTTVASPATFDGVFRAAQSGDVIVLGSGNYGTFSGTRKPGLVTVQAASGASVLMSLEISDATNLRLDGLTLDGGTVGGNSRNITIANSTFTGSTTVLAALSDANIVFDGNTFYGIDACSTCYEGRLSVRGYDNTAPVGVKIVNNRFGNGGGSDGVQIIGDAYGVEIGPGNEFAGIQQGNFTAHVDSIQLYGSSHTKIIGNYFHDDDTIIMAPDGGDHEYISDNVMIGGGYVPAVQLGTHDGTSFVHNTVKNIDVTMDHKAGQPPSSNGLVRNNIFVNGGTNALEPGACSGCTVDHNLFTSAGDASGTSSIIGSPIFVGGIAPAAYAGYKLAAGSPGRGNGSDGTDRGARIDPSQPAATTPSTTPGAPPTAGAAPGMPALVAQPATALRRPSAGLGVDRRVTWAQLRRGLRVKVTTKVRVRVTLQLTRTSPRRSLVHLVRNKPSGAKRYLLRPTALGRRRAQRLTLTATVLTRSGAAARRTVAIFVTR